MSYNLNDYDFMLAKKGNQSRFVKNKNWTYELKADGTRVFLISDDSETKLINRRGKDVSKQFPEVLREFDNDFILDTELIMPTEKKPLGDLNEINKRNTGNKRKIKYYSKKTPAYMLIFDILNYKSEDLRKYPLLERKEYLQFIPKKENYRIMPQFDNFTRLWEKVKNNKYEGIMAKKKNGSYVGKRSDLWLKCKNWKETILSFNKYETHNKGITLENDKGIRVAVLGHQSKEVKEKLEEEGSVDVRIQYLEKTKNDKYRKISFKEMIKK